LVERLKHEAKAREEEAVAVQQKQQNEIARLHKEVARVLAEAEKTSGNLEKAEVHRNQTKDQPDEVLSQFKEIRELKQGMKEFEEARTNIEEADAADVGLAEVGEEMAVLKEQKAEARMATHERRPYIGTEKSLVIGIDVGAAVSGVSYALLERGKVPQIQPVTWYVLFVETCVLIITNHNARFNRGQREEKPNSKVPSVVCYDQDGHVIAVGPETDPEVNPILSEIECVRRAEW
jgi:vacuolar-type H+-ATPase subunit I/STV1